MGRANKILKRGFKINQGYAIVEYLDYQIPDFQLNHIRQNKEEGYSRVPRLSDTRYLAVPRLSDTRYSAVPRL